MYGTPSAWRVPGYTEIRELGAGAAGRVVMARHDADDILVAIKYLSDELRSDVGFVARFRHEARVLNTLDSPHTVRLYDYIETGEGAAIVMELVDGVALRAILRSEGPTGPEAALLVLKGALLGLATAHTAGIVHRDFKPENVMIEADGTSRLVDFGIAVRSGDGDTPAGTPPYMAPEQWTGAPAGPSTDVYAATIVFFECLTGTRPFRATNIAALARQHQAMPPPVEEVPSALQGLVERGLAKHPADRPPTATAFLTELEAVAADAYGPDWQERGRRRLAGLVGIMASLLPLEIQRPETSTSLAETELGGRGTKSASERPSPLSKMSAKILIGIGCIAVISAIGAVLVSSGDSTTLRAQSSVTTPTALGSEPVESVLPDDDTDDADKTDPPTQEPTPKATQEPTPTTSPAEPPSAAPTRRPTPTPKPSRTRTRKPTKSPSTPTRRPSPTPTQEEDGSALGNVDDSRPSSPPAKPTPTPTAAPTQTARPTTRPTPRPTTTTSPSTPPSSPTTSSDPEPTGGESSGGGTPSLTSSPTPPIETAPSALLALGLVTSGAVPFTLAVKRGVAGRHRRRR
ncbi:protein kinase domain-containing protein [Streptosporangium sp. CA-135522]|uniref:serine/threonine-protein kinase n=1 Tax=Streptosporangium sp. CA-135522 TaxID=3240072 RepID=UPI003D8C9351